MNKQDEINLRKRYYAWLYKATKDAFDCYEQQFVQLEIDESILEEVEKTLKSAYIPSEKKNLEKLVNDFRDAIVRKENSCLKLKYKGERINPEFIFLDAKLNAIEALISKEFGEKILVEIKGAYENRMLARALAGFDIAPAVPGAAEAG